MGIGVVVDNNNTLAYLETLCKRAEMNLALIVAGDDDIDLSIKGKSNTIYILELDTGSSVAGGRVGGFGSRRFKMIHLFRLEDGRCVKMKSIKLEGDYDDEEEIDAVVAGGYVVRLPIRLSDGREVMASCLIDQYAVRLLNSRFGIV
ncbi:hypothetical protein HRbin05_00217 [archaeon HR05]|nr:hypothetical protein HRbin05_00217 [archaeon HR05]